MQKVYLDFETASECDLFKSNASVYSNHPSTEILCAVLIREDGFRLEVTDFNKGRPLIEHLIKNKLLVAHNSIFEQLMWQNILVKKFGYSERPPSTWRCTRAKLQSHSLPGSLEKGAEALNLLQQKDMGSRRLMLKMCKPNGPRDEISMKSLISYCKQDVLTTIEIDKVLPDLSPFEFKVWELDQEINLRGIRADKPLVEEIIGLVDDERQRLTSRFEHLVQGQVNTPNSSVGLKKYLQAENIDASSTDAKEVRRLLADKNLPANIREILEIRQTLAKSSVAKYKKILGAMDADERLRENLVYHGAGTGRWTGQGVQLQNLPRPKKGFNVDYALETISVADVVWPSEYNSVNAAASSLVRSVLIPSEGKAFIGGDYAGIEARITPWIAGQEHTLEDFKNGIDPYLKSASGIYGREIFKKDENERQVGKASILFLGFQGGIAAFFKGCQILNFSLTPIAKQIIQSATVDELDKAAFVYSGYLKEAEKSGNEYFNKEEGMCADIIKQRWRANNQDIVEFWKNVNYAAIDAVKINGFATIPVHRSQGLNWVLQGNFLYCILPSGRKMAYYKPKVESLTNKFGVTKETLTYVGIDSTTKQLYRERTYGGKLTENIVQAIARDVMVEGMFNIKNYGLSIAITVHDEILSEGNKETNLEEVKECFIRPIKWAPGLPLDAEVWKGYRYRK